MFTKFYCRSILCFFILLTIPNHLFAQLGESALSFDGVDDYVLVPDSPSLDMTNGFTIAAWIYLNKYTEWASIVTKGGFEGDPNFGENNYTIHQSGPAGGTELGHLRFTGSVPNLPTNPLPESNSVIPLHEWHHVAVTFNGSTLRFYLDGRPDGKHALEGPMTTNDDPLNIGVDFPGGDEYWHGSIDELMIFRGSIRTSGIRKLLHEEPASISSSLVGFWRFNEGHGDVAHDLSRKKNHGQLKGKPKWKKFHGNTPGLAKAATDELEGIQPDVLVLASNYPNPFNPSTVISYTLPRDANVHLEVWNALGQSVAKLFNGRQSAGTHQIVFNAEGLPSGIYIYRLQIGSHFIRKRMLLMK